MDQITVSNVKGVTQVINSERSGKVAFTNFHLSTVFRKNSYYAAIS